MNRRAQRLLAAIPIFLAFLAPPQMHSQRAQEEEEWSWSDSAGHKKTRADLDKILAEHQRWLESGKVQGSRANLKGANLNGADFLSDANLDEADLSNAHLSTVVLTNAHLSKANLDGAYLDGGAHLEGAHLDGASLIGAHLNNASLIPADPDGGLYQNDVSPFCTHLNDERLIPADLDGAHLDGADLTRAHLNCARLDDAHLNDAHLNNAHLDGAHLDRADLNGADLDGAHLDGAHLDDGYLDDADLDGADLDGADLNGATFEPASSPNIRVIATAGHLELTTYKNNPDALAQLRKQFKENGFQTQERKITYALSRRKAEREGFLEWGFQTVAFDLTCQYGMNPGRALKIWLAVLLICSLVYAVFAHVRGESGIYRILKLGEVGREVSLEVQIRPRPASPDSGWPHLTRLIFREGRVLFWALFFSLISAFNIGFRDINFGRWLRLLPRGEYDLKAKGWTRTVAGFQSLVSVYLIALWVLTYFSRPFD